MGSKQEIRTPDGIVQGTYSYVDANGVLQTVNYVSDAEGFKVAATNLPKAPLPEAVAPVVAETYVAPAATPESDDMEVVAAQEKPAVAPYATNPVYQYYAPQQGYYQTPVAPVAVQAPVQQPLAYYAPTHAYHQAAVPVAAPQATVVPVAPAAPAPSHSQFHAQDDIGGYNYGYATADSSKQEIRTPDGIVQGTYSYVDANGVLQTVNYVSDAEGFKVAATNLPQAPVVDV